MKDKYTDITFVLDRSGSMASVQDATISGYNEFLGDQQKEDGDCTFTLVQFDTIYEFVHKAMPIKDVPKLSTTTFQPRGMTALLDATARAIRETGERLREMNEDDRPSKVIFVIQTDGDENSSTEYRGDEGRRKLFEFIKLQQDTYKWEFIFLGANQDAIKAGASMGISSGKSITYASNVIGTQTVYKSVNKIVSNIRSGKGPQDFEASDRSAQTDAGAK